MSNMRAIVDYCFCLCRLDIVEHKYRLFLPKEVFKYFPSYFEIITAPTNLDFPLLCPYVKHCHNLPSSVNNL